MKDQTLRRIGRRHDTRVYRANRELAANREVTVKHYERKHRTTNWRIRRMNSNEVVAIEPGRDYKEVFNGGTDPLMEALEYAAEQLRKGGDD